MKRLLVTTIVLGCVAMLGSVAQADLVGHWTLDDGAGTDVTDSSASAFHGVIPTDVYLSDWSVDTPPVAFANPYSLRFDGANDFVSTAFAGIGGAGTRTVAAWIKTTDVTDHGIVAWGDSSGNGLKYHVRVNSNANNADSGLKGGLRTEVQGGYRVGATTISDGEWHHIVSMLPEGANNQNQVLLYVDGVLETSNGGSRVINTALGVHDVSIGRRVQGTSGKYYEGLIDDVRIYDTELSTEEIVALAGATPRTDNLVGHWNFDEGPGATTTADLAGGNAGTLNNMVTDDLPAWSDDVPPSPFALTGSMAFNGSSAFVDTPFAGIGGSASRTITAWVKTESTASAGIVAWGDSGTNGEKWHFRLNDNAGNGELGGLRVEVAGGYIIGATNIADGEWHHLAATFAEDADPNIDDVLIYVDGQLQTPSGVKPFAVNTDISEEGANVTIGRRSQGAGFNYFGGLIADARIYDEALDAATIRGLVVVPEPSSLALLAAGLLGIIMLRSRRRVRNS